MKQTTKKKPAKTKAPEKFAKVPDPVDTGTEIRTVRKNGNALLVNIPPHFARVLELESGSAVAMKLEYVGKPEIDGNFILVLRNISQLPLFNEE